MISVLVVDEAAEIHARVAALLAEQPDVELTGGASSAAEALRSIAALRPDVVLLSMDLPPEEAPADDLVPGTMAGVDAPPAPEGARAPGTGAALAEAVTSRFPAASIIMTSWDAAPEQLRRAMLAGARHFLVKPFDAAELTEGIHRVYRLAGARRDAPAPAATAPAPARAVPAGREGMVFTFYSAKGGAGCTTLACNTAVALKRATGKEVALFDCGLLFGDVGVVLNLDPRSTIVDVLPQLKAHTGPLDPDFLSQMMVFHASGVKVLLAPPSPEKAELITAEHIGRILAALRSQFDYVLIDTWPTFEERILTVLDAADRIVVPSTLEMPAIKNCKLLLEVASALAYVPDKVALVLNRADSRGGIRLADVEKILQKRFAAEVVSDGRLTTHSLNDGVPFVMTHPEAPISHDVLRLAATLAGIPLDALEAARPKRAGLLRTVFGT